MRYIIWIGVGIAAVAAWLYLRPAPAVAAETVAPEHVDAFLAPHREALEAMRRPVARVELLPFPEDELSASKVGGRAWWPADRAAPMSGGGQPLVLLAQVNFAEMPALPGYPTKGLLQFFIASNDYYGANFDGGISPETLSVQRDFRVVYWPDTSMPSKPLPVAAADMTPHDPRKPRRMRFAAGEETLSVDDYRFHKLFGGDAYAAAERYATRQGLGADALFDAVYERHAGVGHKLGGYPFFTQEDPRGDGDWELLLQLDSDDEMMWGDVGVGGFFIRPADLARADFSRVFYSWDCH